MADDLGHEATPLAPGTPQRLPQLRWGLPTPIDPPTIPTETRWTGRGDRGRQVLLPQARTPVALWYTSSGNASWLALGSRKRTSGLLSAQRWHRTRVAPTTPTASDHRPSATSLDRGAPIAIR